VGSLRDFEVALPAGFLGNPAAVGECTPAELTSSACPGSSQVGRVDLTTTPLATFGPFSSYSLPVYNMTAPRGAVADLAFQASGNPVHVKLALDPAHDYSVVARAQNLNETAPSFDMRLTLWGIPVDPAHDSERCRLPDTSDEMSGRLRTQALPDAPFGLYDRTCLRPSRRRFLAKTRQLRP
jgi:hypothetical protein